MTWEGWLLLSWTLVGAAWLVVHVWAVWLALRSPDLRPVHRLLALVPPAAPILAWRAGRRVAPALWVLLMVGYVGLRMLG